MMKEIKLKAFAKINLWLDCLYKREDGYHEIVSVMQAINLYDDIILKKEKNIVVETNHPLVPDDKRNLAFQAAYLLHTKFPKRIPGVSISIQKKIPVEAGLAGGSTDAAAVLSGMNKLFALNLSQKELLAIGSQLGSDVPFCLAGPTALAEGRGEKLSPLPTCPEIWVVLIKPPFGVSTGRVYHNLVLGENESKTKLKEYLKALQEGDKEYIIQNVYNILEKSTFQLYPEIQIIKEHLNSLGAPQLLMSGSGPTLLAFFPKKEEALTFAKKVPKNIGEMFIVRTLNSTDMLGKGERI